MAALGAKKAATGRSFLQFIILDDGGAGGEVGFFFVKKSEFLLAFCVVSVFLIEKGFADLGIVFVSLGEKQVGDALLKEVLQKIVGFDGGAGGVFFVVAKDEVVAVEEGFEICQQDEAVFDLGEIVAFSGEGFCELSIEDFGDGIWFAQASEWWQIGQFVQSGEMIKI